DGRVRRDWIGRNGRVEGAAGRIGEWNEQHELQGVTADQVNPLLCDGRVAVGASADAWIEPVQGNQQVGVARMQSDPVIAPKRVCISQGATGEFAGRIELE